MSSNILFKLIEKRVCISSHFMQLFLSYARKGCILLIVVYLKVYFTTTKSQTPLSVFVSYSMFVFKFLVFDISMSIIELLSMDTPFSRLEV